MHAILSHLLASILLVQALFGWCGRPPYKEVNCDTSAGTFSTKSCCNQCGTNAQGEHPVGPCKCEFECQGVCTYVRPEKTLVDSSQWSLLALFLEVDPALAGSHSAFGSIGVRACHPLDSKPPLRLHLVHQVLLI